MKRKIIFIIGIIACLCLCACSNSDSRTSSNSKNPPSASQEADLLNEVEESGNVTPKEELESSIEKAQNEYNASSSFSTSLIYERKMDEKMILPPNWLNESLVSWVSEIDNTDMTLYQVQIVNLKDKSEDVVYEKRVESGHKLDVDVAFFNNNMYIYFFDKMMSSLDKIALDFENLEITSEETFIFPYKVSLSQKSAHDIIIAKETFAEQSNTFNWDIVLFPLEDQEGTYQLKQNNRIRYDFSNKIWSLSGEYFYLLNYDALGMDRFDSLADLFAYPKTEWPVQLQYDTFYKDGRFAFSFTIDFTHYDDGSNSSEDIFWIPGDQIFIASTFYNATSDSYYTKERVIDASGRIIGEWSYDGYRNHYLPHEFDTEGVYYGERRNNSIHLLYKHFIDDGVIDYGPVLEFTAEAFISPHPNLNKNLLLVTDHKQQLRILELIE